MGKYTKAIVAILGAVVTTATTVWPDNHWATVISSLATAVLVFLAPNTPKQ